MVHLRALVGRMSGPELRTERAERGSLEATQCMHVAREASPPRGRRTIGYWWRSIRVPGTNSVVLADAISGRPLSICENPPRLHTAALVSSVPGCRSRGGGLHTHDHGHLLEQQPVLTLDLHVPLWRRPRAAVSWERSRRRSSGGAVAKKIGGRDASHAPSSSCAFFKFWNRCLYRVGGLLSARRGHR